MEFHRKINKARFKALHLFSKHRITSDSNKLKSLKILKIEVNMPDIYINLNF
jgi:hypothetical protein